MNREQLIEQIATEADISKAAAQRAVAAFVNVVQNAVAAGDKVTITGFGVFDSVKTAERQGRNPQTGQPVTIAAGIRPKFSPGKGFKNAVSGA